MTQLPNSTPVELNGESHWPYIHHRRFESANLSGIELRDASLRRRRFRLCSLSAVELKGVDLRRSQFFKCDLSRSTFDRCQLGGVLFANCRMNDMRVRGCDLSGAKITHILMDNSDLANTPDENAGTPRNNFNKTILRDVHFRNCKLAHLDLTQAKVRRLEVSGDCDLTGLRLTKKQVRKSVVFVGVAVEMIRKLAVRGVAQVEKIAVILPVGAARKMSSITRAFLWTASSIVFDAGGLAWNRAREFINGGYHLALFVYPWRATLRLLFAVATLAAMMAAAWLILFTIMGLELHPSWLIFIFGSIALVLLVPATNRLRRKAKRRKWLLRNRAGLETSTLQMGSRPR